MPPGTKCKKSFERQLRKIILGPSLHTLPHLLAIGIGARSRNVCESHTGIHHGLRKVQREIISNFIEYSGSFIPMEDIPRQK